MPGPGEADHLARVELVPGALAAEVSLLEIASRDGPLGCWSYRSDGLRAHGQAELRLTLRRRPDEAPDAYPTDPLELFRAIGELARVAARLGDAWHHFPYPPWSDRDRPSVYEAAEMSASLLDRLARLQVAGASVLRLGDSIELTLPRTAVPLLRDELPRLPETVPLAILTGLDERANAWLVWAPGRGPSGISPEGSDGSRLGGCFCAVVGERAADEGQVFEDGFVLFLASAAARRVRGALTAGNELEIPLLGGASRFVLRWRE